MTDPVVTAQIAALEARGGTPTVSSGGALGDYLETRCPDAPSLAGAYARALDAVGTDHLDVDVETDAGRDVPLDRVAQALAQLQRERGTRITLTVQIEDAATGMTPDALEMVRAATVAGVAARVDLMVMNFGYEGSWADAMTGALDASLRQLAALWPGSTPTEVAARVGVTYMLGRNDTDATTQLPDAAELVDEAARRGVGAVGFWALARDNGGCPRTDTEADDCSGIAQDAWAFTRATQAFARR
jgi:chitinase